jgi:hypothetical protein
MDFERKQQFCCPRPTNAPIWRNFTNPFGGTLDLLSAHDDVVYSKENDDDDNVGFVVELLWNFNMSYFCRQSWAGMEKIQAIIPKLFTENNIFDWNM